jgi:cob(I)alamin adenosyltransferase
LLVVYTGEGKGKTTAALGGVFRAWGHGLRVCVVQFIKSDKGRWGEVKAAERLGIGWHTLGDGFVWDPSRQAESRRLALEGWRRAQEVIVSGDYDLVVLDELTYLFKFGWLAADEVVVWLRDHKPAALHLIVTGRDAPGALLDAADLVTEMRAVKHPYDKGIAAQRGIEF